MGKTVEYELDLFVDDKINGEFVVPGQENEVIIGGTPTYCHRITSSYYALLSKDTDDNFIVRKYSRNTPLDPSGADKYTPKTLRVLEVGRYNDLEEARSHLDAIKSEFLEEYEPKLTQGIYCSRIPGVGRRPSAYKEFMKTERPAIVKRALLRAMKGQLISAYNGMFDEREKAERHVGNQYSEIYKVSDNPIHLSQEIYVNTPEPRGSEMVLKAA